MLRAIQAIKDKISVLLIGTNFPVYHELASGNMPYVVFYLDVVTASYDRLDGILTIDVWDDSSDTTAIETIVDTLLKGLQNQDITNQYVGVSFFRDSVRVVSDPVESVRRRQMQFYVNSYIKE